MINKKLLNLAKTITRDEFFTRYDTNDYMNDFTCPEDLGLEERDLFCRYNNEDDNNCRECWEYALHNIQFKDDIEKEPFTITCNNCGSHNVSIKEDIDYDYDENPISTGDYYLYCNDCGESEDR